MSVEDKSKTRDEAKGEKKARRPTLTGVIKNLQGETCFTIALWMTQPKKQNGESDE